MPIDPNIALGVRPVEMPNMLGQMGQMMQLRQAQQGFEEQNALRDAFSQGADINDPATFKRIAGINPKLAMELRAKDIESQGKQTDVGLKRTEYLGAAYGGLVKNPTIDNAYSIFDNAVAMGIMPRQAAEGLRAKIAATGGDPKQIAALAQAGVDGAIDAKAKMQDATSRANNAATVGATIRGQDLTNARAMEGTWSNVIVGRRVMQQNSRTGEVREVQDPYSDTGGTVTVGPMTTLPETSTGGGVVTGGGGGPAAPIASGAVVPTKPNVLAENVGATPSVNALRNPPVAANVPVAKTRPPVTNPLMVEEKPVWNEKAGVWMIPPTAENPQGKVVDTPEVKRIVQTRAANETLKIAGFNPKTGSDEISELIKQSTSGLGQNWGSKAWGAITGTGTSGAKAIAALETRANELTLGLAPNGSLGAGFSNEDRDFMLKKLGDVANPNAPMNVRLAAWEDVMERAARTAGVPYPKSFSSAATAAPSGKIDTSNKFLQ